MNTAKYGSQRSQISIFLTLPYRSSSQGILNTKSMLTLHVKQNFIMRHEKSTMLKSLDPATHFSYN